MNKLLRLFMLFGGAIVSFLVIAVVVVILIVDPNDYRQEISDVVYENTGRELAVGNMALSVFPWVGVALNQVALGNAPGFDGKFATLDTVDVKVKLLPLLRKEIVVDQVQLHGLALTLVTDQQGKNNWQDLAGTPAKPTVAPKQESVAPATSGASSPTTALAALAIGGLSIKDAQLIWLDRQNNLDYRIEQLNLLSSAITLGQPFDLDLTFTALSKLPKASAKVAMSSRITLALEQQQYRLDDLAIDLNVDSKELLPKSPMQLSLASNVMLDMQQQQLKLQQLQLASQGVKLGGDVTVTQLMTAPSVDLTMKSNHFNARSILTDLAIEFESQDSSVLSDVALDLQAVADAQQIELKQLGVTLDQTTLNGQATLSDFSNPAIRFKINLDQIDVDRYLPPVAEQTTNTQQAAAVAAAPAAPLALPIDMLRSLNLQGDIAVGLLKVSNLKLNELELGIHAKQGLVALAPINLSLYSGEMQASSRLDVRGKIPKLQLEESLTGVQINPLLKDLLDNDLAQGKANISASITTEGQSVEAFKAALNGKGRVQLVDGAIKGVNIAYELEKAYAAVKGKPAPKLREQNQTDFASLKASFKISNGVVHNEDLLLEAPLLRVTGKGQADLLREQLDYRPQVSVVESTQGQGGADLGELKGLTVPMRIYGDFAKPTIRVELDKLLKQKAEEELKRQSKKLEEKAKKDLEKKAKDELKKLFRF